LVVERSVGRCRPVPQSLSVTPRRDAAAAKRFFRKALGQPYTVNPRTITVGKNPAYPSAVEQMKEDGKLWRRSRLRRCKFLNETSEQDHRGVKGCIRGMRGFIDPASVILSYAA
jgi:transposase-like protein